MVKFSFDSELPNSKDEPWTKLDTVREHLDDGSSIPPDLALWLSNAIRFSDRKPNELLKRLDLKQGRGRPNHAHATDAWMVWGAFVWEREHQGESKEAAISKMIDEYIAATGKEVSRSQAQAWREEYREARRSAGAS